MRILCGLGVERYSKNKYRKKNWNPQKINSKAKIIVSRYKKEGRISLMWRMAKMLPKIPNSGIRVR
jgi:hypothetical protein